MGIVKPRQENINNDLTLETPNEHTHISMKLYIGVFILGTYSPHFHIAAIENCTKLSSVQILLLDVYMGLYHGICWRLSQSLNWESRS